ncbi:YkvA family protein [Halobacillus shinanisalinarum]|uniref:YkvA family protein n=1 Tax=Halobacillus shinanisalinarum TaxID=2932258 RepID=A0ABY4H1Z9_9BACI|nr:YkvA family protein [Halobacillus shinanisalinarum]UOQ94466.1 YkvA family protein [Halobacillus shinanisalinarum]
MKKAEKNKAGKLFEKLKKRAGTLVQNPAKTKQIIEQAQEKSEEHQGPLSKVWEELQLMFQMVRDWARGDYQKAPKGSIVAIVGGVLYFVIPLDVLPDFIPVAGLIDDVYIINLVIKQVNSDLQAYKRWLAKEPKKHSPLNN